MGARCRSAGPARLPVVVLALLLLTAVGGCSTRPGGYQLAKTGCAAVSRLAAAGGRSPASVRTRAAAEESARRDLVAAARANATYRPLRQMMEAINARFQGDAQRGRAPSQDAGLYSQLLYLQQGVQGCPAYGF